MKKPWSITTTLRNPERLRSFLSVLTQIEGQDWNLENQSKYQILLIKERVYGYGRTQFYNGLNQEQINLIDDQSQEIPFAKAEEIFIAKNYEDPAMRGRQSINPLKKIGLVVIKEEKIFITSLGKLFLKDDFDLGEIFFRSFIKWQLPNPDSTDYKFEDGYNIKPFIGILHLINTVNKKSFEIGTKEKGISKQEFSLFCPTLASFKNIERYAEKIIKLRKKQNIIPLTIINFSNLLKILVKIKKAQKFLEHQKISRLYDLILDASKNLNHSDEWLKSIPESINSWQSEIFTELGIS